MARPRTYSRDLYSIPVLCVPGRDLLAHRLLARPGTKSTVVARAGDAGIVGFGHTGEYTRLYASERRGAHGLVSECTHRRSGLQCSLLDGQCARYSAFIQWYHAKYHDRYQPDYSYRRPLAWLGLLPLTDRGTQPATISGHIGSSL